MNKIGMQHLPPQDLEAEQSILARCIIQPADIDDICEVINHSDFYRDAHKKIFQAIIALSEKKIYPELNALVSYLRQSNQLEEIGGPSYLAKLLDSIPIATNINHYCKIIRGKSILRQLINKAQGISRHCFESNGDFEGVLDQAQRDILSVDVDFGQQDFVQIKDMLSERIDFYEERFNSKSELTGISSGFSKIDFLTAGFQGSDLIILAGRTSHGKTAMMLNLIHNAALDGIVSGVFTLEMSKEQLFDRIIAMRTGINSMKFRTGRFSNENWQGITSAMGELSEWKVLFDELTFDAVKISRKARRMKKAGAQIIFIDYLSLVKGENDKTRHEEVASNTRAFKRLAKELNLPVVLLVQLNRAFKDRKDKRPILADLRESGEIEQSADVVMFIYRKEQDTRDEADSGIAELIIEKQRNGPLGNVGLFFNKYTTKFGLLESEASHE